MNQTTPQPCSIIALLSGGLDSILAARLMQSLGHPVTCLHFVTPFFGKPHKVPHWQKIHGLTIECVDVGDEFAAMLAARPEHGFGKVLNPCVDCKILMLRRARAIMEERGASAIVTGEVLGQRPMSQRRDTLNVIQREAGVKGLLLRPLCAKVLDETPMEAAGLIERSRLLSISGRGRKDQLAMAQEMGIREIPTPAGGCLLAERENARSYWPILLHAARPGAADFHLANTGRQYWSFASGPLWLAVGRNKDDNARLLELAAPGDMLFKVADFPGPIGLARPLPASDWTPDAVRCAAAFCASFSPKAARHAVENGELVSMRIHDGSVGLDGPGETVAVRPDRTTDLNWAEYDWKEAKEAIRNEARERAMAQTAQRQAV